MSAVTMYRGQPNSEWQLSPRLYREGLFKYEGSLVEEFLRINPTEFDGLELFDRLVKMQHYGLPTRLLDTTTNPLVALFFACFGEEHSSVSGRVYIFPSLPVFRPSNSVVKLNAYFVFHFSGRNFTVNRLAQELEKADINAPEKSFRDLGDFALYYLASVPFIAVLPSLRNDRIRVQDGAFLLCGMKMRYAPPEPAIEMDLDALREFFPFDFNKPLKEIWKPAITLLISPDHKSKILSELALLGISKGRIFPELEHQAEQVVKLVRDGGTINFRHGRKA